MHDELEKLHRIFEWVLNYLFKWTQISARMSLGQTWKKTAFMKTSIFVWRWYQVGEINPAYFEDFFLVDAFCVGPFWDDVIQHPLAKIPGHFVDHHELFHWVEHFMVFGRGLSQISGMVTDSNSVLFSVRSSIFNMNDWLCTKRLRCQYDTWVMLWMIVVTWPKMAA